MTRVAMAKLTCRPPRMVGIDEPWTPSFRLTGDCEEEHEAIQIKDDVKQKEFWVGTESLGDEKRAVSRNSRKIEDSVERGSRVCDRACQEFQNTQRSRRGEKTGRFPFGVGIDRQEEFLVREPPISSAGRQFFLWKGQIVGRRGGGNCLVRLDWRYVQQSTGRDKG